VIGLEAGARIFSNALLVVELPPVAYIGYMDEPKTEAARPEYTASLTRMGEDGEEIFGSQQLRADTDLEATHKAAEWAVSLTSVILENTTLRVTQGDKLVYERKYGEY
jgi:hypothetical protein